MMFFRRNWDAFSILWNDGERVLLICAIGAIAISLGTAMVVMVATFMPRSHEAWTPVTLNPVTVSPTVVQPGDKLIVDGQICNTSDEFLFIQLITRLTSTTNSNFSMPGISTVIEIDGDTCKNGIEEVVILAVAPAGTYMVTGDLIVHNGHPAAQVVAFESQTFRVIRPEGCCGPNN